MKSNIKKILLVLIVVAGVLSLTACTKEENKSENKDSNQIDSKLIGTWNCDYYGVESTFVFNKDKTGSEKLSVEGNSSDRSYTYKTKDNEIIITFDDDKEFDFTYGYRFDKDKLVLKDTTEEEFSCEKE